ncbi:MAG: hypothetical protein WCW13_01610 [archaeon]|jgi:hypothetical protein
MAKVIGKNISLNSEEASILGEGKELEIVPNGKGIFLFIEKSMLKETEGTKVCIDVPQLEEESQEVIGLIRKGDLSNLVEGKFESTLNEKQKKALLQLVVSGKVFVFKLNQTYKKGVYRVKEEEEAQVKREIKESENILAIEKPFDQYNLEQDGFLIIKGKDRAMSASHEFERSIKEGLLKGIKSFDGNYYLIQTDLLNDYIKKTISAFEPKPTLSLEELSLSIKASQMLTKVICEFLKEEGELMEKKKGLLHYIK